MLKKLRNKLLLLNMVSLAVVIIVSFAVIYFMQFQHTRGVDVKRLGEIPTDVIVNELLAERSSAGAAAGADGSTEQTDAGGSGETEDEADTDKPYIDNSGPDLPIDYSNFFVLNTAVDGKLRVFSRINLSDSDYRKAALKAMGKDGSKRPRVGDIKLGGSHWLYSYSANIPNNIVITEKSVGQVQLSGLPVSESIVFLNIDTSDKAMKELLLSMFLIGACVLAGLFLISLLFSNRALRPTEESLRRQRQFIADASHELKTPLAIIDANTEVALSEPKEAEMWIGRIADESGRMRGLIDDLLFLARSEDTADIQMEKLPVDLSSAVEQEIGRVEAVLFERGIVAECKKPDTEDVVVNSDGARIRQIILILLDNAMKYTDRNGHITVETEKTKRYGRIKVSNTGEGISPEDLPHIFDRFYRSDKARTSAKADTGAGSAKAGAGAARGGYGLGLAIAKAIVERAGGKITAESKDGLTSFTVELPLT